MQRLLELDEQALVFLNNLGCLQYDEFWMYITNQNTWIPLYIVLFIIVLQQYKLRHSIVIFICIGICFFLTDFVVSNFIKDNVARLRPCHTELADQLRLVKPSCGGKYGFFSSHAANTFGLAVLLGKIMYAKYKYAIYFLVIWASIIAYSRIYIGVHYPLDVICGVLYGILAGNVCYFLYKKLW